MVREIQIRKQTKYTCDTGQARNKRLAQWVHANTRNTPDALACTSRDYLVRVEQDGDLVYDGTRTLTQLRPAG